MCDVIGSALRAAHEAGLSRRSLFRGMGVAATAAGLGATTVGCSSPSGAVTPLQPEPQSGPQSGSRARDARTRLVLLGTGGGPILDPSRAGVSTAIVYDGHVYVVDLGFSAHQRLVAADLGGSGIGTGFNNVRGVLFTHMHSDHLAEWPAFYALAPGNLGEGAPESPIQVFGPGPRDTLPRVFPPDRHAPQPIAADDPTPGVAGMTDYLRRAWAADLNDRVRDTSFPDPGSIFQVHDIDVSPYWSVGQGGVPPRLAPFPVWTDGDVRVTATLVDHHPTAPAFGFRFDTPDGSIVVSGDTAPSENLIELARGADYLVHEVIDTQFVENLVAHLPPEQAGPSRAHLTKAHTTTDQVGRVAEQAGVANLVLSHLVPSNNPPERWQAAQQNFSGRLVIGQDLMQLPVGGS